MLKNREGIHTIKLATGEEVIAKIIGEEAGEVIVSKPFIIAMSHQGVGMAPLSVTGDMDMQISISKNQIISIINTREDAKNDYIRITTGIEVPNSQAGRRVALK